MTAEHKPRGALCERCARPAMQTAWEAREGTLPPGWRWLSFRPVCPNCLLRHENPEPFSEHRQ